MLCKRSAELQALNKKLYQEEQEKQTALKQQEAEDSFYQKLADGFDANILIVGDSIGEGAGTETNDCTVKNEIKVVFTSKEQADGFKGMYFSWE